MRRRKRDVVVLKSGSLEVGEVGIPAEMSLRLLYCSASANARD
jgi:hypothetical protein